MSFFLDPLLLFFLGIILLGIKLRFKLPPQQIRIIGIVVVSGFILISATLFFDLIIWPINLFDWIPPIFEPISGRAWMLHTDITGIKEIPELIAFFLFSLYLLWFYLGYQIARTIFDPHSINILSGPLYNKSHVKSQKRAKTTGDEPLIAVVRNSNSKEALRKAIKRIGGIKRFIQQGDKVVIKINICGGNPLIKGSFTSIEVVEEVISMIRNVGGDPILVDSDMIWTDFEPVASAQGWVEWSQQNKVPLVNLRKTDCVKFDFGASSVIKKNSHNIVSKLMVDADVIISIPTMKTHLMTNVTLGMKNMYGTFPTGEKALYHEFGIEDVIVDICNSFTPTLTIIDGSIGGETVGPLSCRPVNSDVIIVSNDVVAADAAAASIMGFDPLGEIVHIKKAHELGIGKGDLHLEIDGEKYEKDGNWVRPNPEVCMFYNRIIEEYLQLPGSKAFFNAAADFLLYDTANLDFLKDLTPIVLGLTSDIFGSVFGLFSGFLRGGIKKKQIVRKIGEHSKKNRTDYPSNLLKTKVDQIISEKSLQTIFLPLLVILSAFIGFFAGGYWEKTLSIFNSQPDKIFTPLIFVSGLLISGLGVLIYGSKMEVKSLITLSILASFFAFFNEYLLVSIKYLKYLEGDLITLLFAILGYPLFIVFIFGASDWIIKYSHLPEFKDRYINCLPVLGILILSSILFVLEDIYSLFLNAQLLTMLSSALMLIFLAIFAFYYGLNHSYRQNLTLIIVSALIGAIMEILGYTSEFWTYYTPNVPFFIIVLWSMRILAIGGVMTILKMKVLKHGYNVRAFISFRNDIR